MLLFPLIVTYTMCCNLCSIKLSLIQFLKPFAVLLLFVFYDYIHCVHYYHSESLHSTDGPNVFNSTLNGNESLDEDLIILSSWESLKIWSSNSSLHTSKRLLNFDILDADKTNARKITAIDYYYNEDLCENIFIWSDISRQTIYSGILNLNDEKPYFTKVSKLLQTNFGNHLRLAVDKVFKIIYLALFEFQRIDFYDIKSNTYKNFLSNISRPVDIAIDSKLQILFWIENWSCISHISISNKSIVRMCSSNPRALAVDIINTRLYWSDSDGNIYRKNYFNQTNEIISSTKKMRQSYALDVSNDAIYMSDQYKLTSLMRSNLITKVVLIESPGILDFKVIKRRHFYCHQHKAHTCLSNSTLVDNSSTNDTNESMKSFVNMTDDRMTASDYIKDRENQSNNFFSKYLVLFICCSVLICLTFIICFVIILLKRYCVRRGVSKTNKITRNRSAVRKIITNDKSKLINNKNISKTVCIEDLGSFSNNGTLDQRWFCSNCPIRPTCSSCEDKEECIERGICLSTYKLLS